MCVSFSNTQRQTAKWCFRLFLETLFRFCHRFLLRLFFPLICFFNNEFVYLIIYNTHSIDILPFGLFFFCPRFYRHSTDNNHKWINTIDFHVCWQFENVRFSNVAYESRKQSHFKNNFTSKQKERNTESQIFDELQKTEQNISLHF